MHKVKYRGGKKKKQTQNTTKHSHPVSPFFPYVSSTGLNNSSELSPCSVHWKGKGGQAASCTVLFYIKQVYSKNSGKCSDTTVMETRLIFKDNQLCGFLGGFWCGSFLLLFDCFFQVDLFEGLGGYLYFILRKQLTWADSMRHHSPPRTDQKSCEFIFFLPQNCQ